MTLQEKIQTDLVAAMKHKEAEKISTLRMLTAAIRNKEIEKRPNPLADDDVLAVVQSEIKKRSDAVADYEKGGRPELAQKEKQEKDFLTSYLPTQLSEEEIRTLIAAAIAESGASTEKDFGTIMKILMPKIKGKAAGNVVSDFVKKQLAKTT